MCLARTNRAFKQHAVPWRQKGAQSARELGGVIGGCERKFSGMGGHVCTMAQGLGSIKQDQTDRVACVGVFVAVSCCAWKPIIVDPF